MLDINFIRNNKDKVKENLKKRQTYEISIIDKVLDLDKKWRELKGNVDFLRSERNKLTLEITKLSKEKKDISSLVAKAKSLPQEINNSELLVENLRKEIDSILMSLPNLLHDSVPYGKDDSENKVVKLFRIIFTIRN